MNKSILENIGLTKIEASIYLLLLQHDSLNGNEISESLSVNRTQVYRALNTLLEKELINSSFEKYNCQYFVSDINKLANYSEKIKNKSLENDKQVREFINKIPFMSNDSFLKSKVKVYRGEDSIMQIYTDRNTTTVPIVREISNNEVFPLIPDDFFDMQIEIRKENNIFLKQLVDVTDDDIKYHRTKRDLFKEVRKIPSDMKFDAGINIFGNKVSFHNNDINNPFSLIIEDLCISKVMENLFEFIWERSEQI